MRALRSFILLIFSGLVSTSAVLGSKAAAASFVLPPIKALLTFVALIAAVVSMPALSKSLLTSLTSKPFCSHAPPTLGSFTLSDPSKTLDFSLSARTSFPSSLIISGILYPEEVIVLIPGWDNSINFFFSCNPSPTSSVLSLPLETAKTGTRPLFFASSSNLLKTSAWPLVGGVTAPTPITMGTS